MGSLILASLVPRSNALVEPGKGGVLRMAPDDEAAKVGQSREPEIPRSRAEAGLAICLYEENCPALAAVLGS